MVVAATKRQTTKWVRKAEEDGEVAGGIELVVSNLIITPFRAGLAQSRNAAHDARQ
jgi:hypothetical protein